MKKPAHGKPGGGKKPHGGGKGAGKGGGAGGGKGGRQKKPRAGRKTPKPKPVPTRVKIARLRRQIHRLQHQRHHPVAHHHRKRQLSPGLDVACCAAEALAASLRLLGVPVGDEDVLALYWHTSADADAGASILATLEAASEFGLAGVRPVEVTEAVLGNAVIGGLEPEGGRALYLHLGVHEQIDVGVVVARAHRNGHGLILGAELPGGPHAFTVAPDGAWWSWGEPYSPRDFPGAVIEEAWEVRWEVPRDSADVH